MLLNVDCFLYLGWASCSVSVGDEWGGRLFV